MLTCLECGRTYPVARGFCPMDGTRLSDTSVDEQPLDGTQRLGEVLDRRYRIDELVGEGGMAHVYRITHTMIGKSLAAKIVRHELRDDDEVVRRFLREAQIVSSIKHPNVVDISDYGELPDNGGAFCVMELLRGRTLADCIDDDGPVQPEAALGVALQICQGLQAAHDAGVVHRDLKPQNVFLSHRKNQDELIVKLIDFGVARAGDRITVAGAVLGTPEYMSPEQVRGDMVDAGADLYALGIVLFELLTGAVPFRADDVALTMQSHLAATPPPMTVVDANLVSLVRTQALIDRLLSKRRSDRPATAAETANLLQVAMEADLGEEVAQRVLRSTVAIGSGGIAGTPQAAVAVAAASPWEARQMPWSPGRDSTDNALPPPAEPDPLEETFEESPKQGAPIALIVVVAAVVAVAATLGVYYAFGIRPTEAPPPEDATVTEIVSSPVPPSIEESERSAAAAKAAAERAEAEANGKSKAGSKARARAKAKSKAGGNGGAVEPIDTQGASNSNTGADASEISEPSPTADDEGTPSKRAAKPRRPRGKPRDAQAASTSTAPLPAHPPTSPSEPKTPTEPPKPKRDGDLRDPFG